jgi:hypothetical protein
MNRVCPNVRHENITLWLAIEIYSFPVSTANGIKFSFIKMSDRDLKFVYLLSDRHVPICNRNSCT